MADQRGRDYSGSTQAVAVTAAQDLAEIVPADDKPLKIIGFVLGNRTDFGDAQAEILPTAVRRGDTVSGSGGSSPTIRADDPHDASAGYTQEANNTTKANTSGVVVDAGGWNVQYVPGVFWYPDNFAPGADQGNSRICHELVAAP